MVAISRDPFARTELHREVVGETKHLTCSWCGMPRMGQSGNRQNLFRYFTVHDAGGSGRGHTLRLFCSKPCHDSYSQ